MRRWLDTDRHNNLGAAGVTDCHSSLGDTRSVWSIGPQIRRGISHNPSADNFLQYAYTPFLSPSFTLLSYNIFLLGQPFHSIGLRYRNRCRSRRFPITTAITTTKTMRIRIVLSAAVLVLRSNNIDRVRAGGMNFLRGLCVTLVKGTVRSLYGLSERE
jgi:hypothetical protein